MSAHAGRAVVFALLVAACGGESVHEEPATQCDPCNPSTCAGDLTCVVFDDANRCAELGAVLESYQCSPCLACDTPNPQAYCCGEKKR